MEHWDWKRQLLLLSFSELITVLDSIRLCAFEVMSANVLSCIVCISLDDPLQHLFLWQQHLHPFSSLITMISSLGDSFFFGFGDGLGDCLGEGFFFSFFSLGLRFIV